MFNMLISRIRDLVNREKIYSLMLAFIILINAWLIVAQKIPAIQDYLAEKELRTHPTEQFDAQVKYPTRLTEEQLWNKVLQKEKHLPAFLGLGVVSALALGLFLDIRILMARLEKRRLLKVKEQHLPVKWGMGDIVKLTIIFIFLGYLLNIIEVNFFSFLFKEKAFASFLPLLNTIMMDGLLLGIIIYFVKVKYRQRLAAIGLKAKKVLKFISLAFLSYIAFLPILAFILLLLILATSLVNYSPPQQALFRLFFAEENVWFLGLATAAVIIIGPVVEEVFFRGFAYNALKKRWGAFRAIVLTAVVFAGLHANLLGFLPIVALGILLAYLYEKTGSLVPSITIHILHNSLMVMLLFLARYFVRLGQ